MDAGPHALRDIGALLYTSLGWDPVTKAEPCEDAGAQYLDEGSLANLLIVAMSEAAALEASLADGTVDRTELAPRAFHLRTLTEWLAPYARDRPMLAERLSDWATLARRALIRADVSEHLTGIPIIDDGPLCERDRERKGCSLATKARERQFVVLAGRVTDALDGATTAVERVRASEIAATAGHWGFIAEILFSTVGGAIASALVKAASRGVTALRAGFASSPEKAIGAVMQGEALERNAEKAVGQLLRSFRNNVRHRVVEPDPAQAPIQFLQDWRNAQVKLAADIKESWPTLLTDDELDAVVKGFAPELHTPEIYEAQIRADLGRFATQVNALGQYPGETHAGWVVADGQRRLALLRSQQGQPMRHHGDQFPTYTGRYEFVRWIDRDLASYAEARESASSSGQVPEVSVAELANPHLAKEHP